MDKAEKLNEQIIELYAQHMTTNMSYSEYKIQSNTLINSAFTEIAWEQKKKDIKMFKEGVRLTLLIKAALFYIEESPLITDDEKYR